MGSLKSIRKTADSKHWSVPDSRSFFTYYCCHSANGLMAIWTMSQTERERGEVRRGRLRSSDFSSSTVIISDDSRCPQTPLKMMTIISNSKHFTVNAILKKTNKPGVLKLCLKHLCSTLLIWQNQICCLVPSLHSPMPSPFIMQHMGDTGLN